MSSFARFFGRMQKPFMVYGYYDPATKIFRKYTRISSSAVIMNQASLSIGDHVWVWHYSILDATEGLLISEGCQIGAWVGIFTHGSENSIRLLGRQFVHIQNTNRKGYTRGSVKIGPFTFVGARSVILPGVTIGKGCLIGSGTMINKDVPDFSIVVGSPGQIKGSTLELDAKIFRDYDFSDTYYDEEALEAIRNNIKVSS
jgi:acetyltransferase-like isoleucine patch superfamily enzyme